MDRMYMRKITPFGLRLQPFLKRKIVNAALENQQSQNREIHERLERSFQQDEDENASA